MSASAPGTPVVSAWRMRLNAGQAAAYRARHDAIYPELRQALLDAGVIDFRIWLDPETHLLFAQLVARADNGLGAMRDRPVMWEWWRMMADIMETNADASPCEWPLEPMFHLAPPESGREAGA